MVAASPLILIAPPEPLLPAVFLVKAFPVIVTLLPLMQIAPPVFFTLFLLNLLSKIFAEPFIFIAPPAPLALLDVNVFLDIVVPDRTRPARCAPYR